MLKRPACVAIVAMATVGISARQQPPATEVPNPVRAGYTKYEHVVPMRDGVKLFTSVYVPKTCPSPYPIMLQRTPYSVAPYGIDNYRTTIGPSDHFLKQGVIVVYQDVRGRYLSEGEWVEVRPHNPKKTARDIDESTDTWDTIEWLMKHVPCNNGRVGMWGISYPGFYVVGRHDRRASGAQGGVAAGAGHRLLPGRRLVPQRRVHAGRQLRVLHELPARGPRPARPEARPPFDYGTPTATSSICRLGPLVSGRGALRPGREPLLPEPISSTPTYDEFWKARAICAALHEHHAGGAHRRRVVRRRGPRRAAAHLPRASSDAEPDHVEPPRDGPVDARRLGARRRRAASATSTSAQKTGAGIGSTSSSRSSWQHLQGQGARDGRAEATMFETGANAWRTLRRVAARRRRHATMSISSAQRHAVDRPRPARGARPTTSTSSDPNRPVPYVRARADGHAARLHDRGSALRRDAARRARLPDAAARRRPHRARADRRRRCTSRRPAPTPTSS